MQFLNLIDNSAMIEIYYTLLIFVHTTNLIELQFNNT